MKVTVEALPRRCAAADGMKLDFLVARRRIFATLRVMDLEAFRRSTGLDAPPEQLAPALTALWWDAKGDWSKAHECAQQDEGPDGAWVHAYLHRKEGDSSNAAYWYRQASRPIASGGFQDEWLRIARTLLSRSGG